MSAFGNESGKATVPPKPDVVKLSQQIRTRYEAAVRSARTFAQRESLALRLMQDASKQSNTTSHYALLRIALQHAVSARSPKVAFRVIEQLDERYEIDVRALQVESLESIADAARANAHRIAVIDAAAPVIEKAIRDGQPRSVASLTESLPLLARRSRDAERRVKAERLAARIQQALRTHATSTAAEATLRQTPDNADAHYTLALASFNTANWNDGVRRLANARQHPQLAALAARDLQGAATSDEFIGLAESWLKASAERSELGGLRGRALYWMHRAIPRLEGQQRMQWETRAREVGEQLKAWKAEQERLAGYADADNKPSKSSPMANQTGPTPQTPNQTSGADATATTNVETAPPVDLPIDFQLDAHKGAANDVCFDPANGRLITCGEDALIHVWDIASRQKTLTLEGHEGAVFAVAVSPDGKKLASVGADKLVRIWNLPSPGRTPAKLPDPVLLRGHTTRIRDVAFARGGAYVITCADDHRVAFWDVKTGRSIAHKEHKGIVYAVAASTSDYTAASVGEDGRMQTWNRTAPNFAVMAHPGKATAVAVSPDGKMLASGGEDKSVRLWLRKGGKRSALPAADSKINSLRFSHDSKLLAVATRGRVVTVWRLGKATHAANAKGLTNEALGISFSPTDQKLAAASRAGKVTVWRTQDLAR